MDMNLSLWIITKYFLRCKKCGHEIIIGENHTAPKKCPNCNATMMAALTEEELNK